MNKHPHAACIKIYAKPDQFRVTARGEISQKNSSIVSKTLPEESVNAFFFISHYNDGQLLMTYSIVAKIPETNEVGIAVASRFFAWGAFVLYITQDTVIASQAFVNPLWGNRSLDLLQQDILFEDVLSILKDEDLAREARQFHGISKFGEIVQHTGTECVDWAGHVKGENVSVAGNMLASPEVIEETLEAWDANANIAFAERLLLTMEAGEAAGGYKRGKQAAAIKIHHGQPYPELDLRVDDHADPLRELRRLLRVADERYMIFKTALPTTDNFSGMVDRGPLDQAIAKAEKEKQKNGYIRPSYSN